MTILEARQAWVRSLIAKHCGGNKAEFARRVGGKLDGSYVSRMLYPPGKDGAKGIGEETMRLIMKAFPNDPPPAHAQDTIANEFRDAQPIFTKARRASKAGQCHQRWFKQTLQVIDATMWRYCYAH